MTFNVYVRGDYKMLMDHIKQYANPVQKLTFEDFNGQTMYTGVSHLGFQTEEERFQFVLTMADKLYECRIYDKDVKWGHIPF